MDIINNKCTKTTFYTRSNGDVQKLTQLKQQTSWTVVSLEQHLANVNVLLKIDCLACVLINKLTKIWRMVRSSCCNSSVYNIRTQLP